MILQNIKRGTAFIFKVGGTVYIRCHGGFRAGRGGPLFSCRDFESCSVYECNPANGQPV